MQPQATSPVGMIAPLVSLWPTSVKANPLKITMVDTILNGKLGAMDQTTMLIAQMAATKVKKPVVSQSAFC